MSDHLLLLLVFVCACLLSVLENIGFLFRPAGLIKGNLVAGYTFQNSLSFASRFVNLVFAPMIAYLADSGKVNVTLPDIAFYFFILCSLLAITHVNEQLLILGLGGIVSAHNSGKSLLRIAFLINPNKILAFLSRREHIDLGTSRISKVHSHLSRQESHSVSSNTTLFALTYIPYYSCWIVISILLSRYPERPALILSFSTFFTLFSTVYQSIFFDPWISRHANNSSFTFAAYSVLHTKKVISSLASFFLVMLYAVYLKP